MQFCSSIPDIEFGDVDFEGDKPAPDEIPNEVSPDSNRDTSETNRTAHRRNLKILSQIFIPRNKTENVITNSGIFKLYIEGDNTGQPDNSPLPNFPADNPGYWSGLEGIGAESRSESTNKNCEDFGASKLLIRQVRATYDSLY